MTTPDLFTVAAQRSARPATSTKRGQPVPFIVHEGDGGARTINPRGRDAWALGELIISGADGCTPIDNPGPRWSGYIFKLRTVYGLNVETIDEQHGGEFSGRHARYVLRSRVAFSDPGDEARARCAT